MSAAAASRRMALVALVACLALGACTGRQGANGGKGDGDDGGITLLPEPDRIAVEVESGTVGKPFGLEDDGECSGGKCVVLPEVWETRSELHPSYRTKEGGALVSAKEDLGRNPRGVALVPNGTVEVPVEVSKAGRYAVHVRAKFANSCANSFFLSVDTPEPVDTNGDGTYDENVPDTLSGSTYERWKWTTVRGRTFDLAAGPHTVRIFNREDGIRLDQVLLVEQATDPLSSGYVPQGMESSHVGPGGAGE